MKKIIRMATVCALAGAALLTACTKDYAVDIAKVQTDVDGAKAEIATLKTNVQTLSTAVTTINSEIATIKTTLASKADKTALDAANQKIAALETTSAQLQQQITAAVAKFANYYTKEEVKAEIAKLYTNAQIDQMLTDAKTACNAYADAAVAANFEAVQNILKGYATKEDLEAALAAAKQYSEVKIGELADQLAEDLASLETALKAYTDDKVQAAVDTLNAAIATLTGRVQSLSFVPEFTTKSGIVAKARQFVLGEKVLLEKNVTVEATYAVKPATKTAEVFEALKTGKANLVYVNTTSPVTVETKAAGNVLTAAISASRINEETGNIDIVANLNKFEGKGAIALVYDVEGTAQLASEFVTVYVETYDLVDNYVLCNDAKKVYESQEVEKPWNEVPSQVDWFAGYDIKIVFDEVYYTPAEFATLAGLPEGSLDLKYKVAYTDTTNGALEYPKAGVLNFKDDFTRMVTDLDKTKAAVDKSATSASTFYYEYGSAQIPVLTYANVYTIVKRTINIVLEGVAEVIPWTYNLALALSSKTEPAYYLDEALCYNLDKPFTQNFLDLAFQFKESKVVEPEAFTKDQEVSIYDLINNTPTPVTEAILNGTKVNGVSMKVDDVAIIKSKIAGVVINGYKFAKDVENKYVITNTYSNTTDQLKIQFSMTLGKCAPDATLALTPAVIDFPAKASAEAPESFKNIFDATQTPFFKDFSQFKAAKANAVEVKSNKNGNTVVNNTYATIGDAKSSYTLSAGDVKTFGDVFTTNNTFTTWFGNVYTVNGKITLKAQAQALAFWTDRVDVSDAAVAAVKNDASLVAAKKDVTGVATLEGQFNNFWGFQRYYVNNDDLSKYFKALNVPAATKEAYTVTYAIVNTATAPAYANLPALTNEKVQVVDVEKCELSTSPISWNEYANRTLIVKATLNYDNDGTAMKIADKTLFLQTAKPVTVAAGSVEKPFATNTTIKFYVPSVLSVKGIMAPETELVNQASENLFLALAPAAVNYGVEFTLPEDVTISFNGETYNTKTFPGQKFAWDKTTGTLSYKTDAATITDDITIKAKFGVKYYYMYWGNTADQNEFVATFVVKK